MAERNNVPTDSMVAAAKRALEWKKEGKRGGTSVGLARANQIVNRVNLSDSTVKRMYSFFSRHEVDKRATGFNSGEEGFPSPGRVAWDLWGGDAGFSWSRKKTSSMEKSIDESSLTSRQDALYEAIESVTEEFGPFDKSSGPDGIHYIENNPFGSEGLKCENCAFYMDGKCELLSLNDNDVLPTSVCKFWIIPEEKLLEKNMNDPLELEKRDYNAKQRRQLAGRGQAMPDGSYPIANEQDLKNAIQSFGRAKNPTAVKRHIITRARALGLTDLLPEEWKTKKNVGNGFEGVFLPE